MRVTKLLWVGSAALSLLSGCYQLHEDQNELCTIPVTNNPNIVPSQGQSFNLPSAPM